MSSSSIYEIVDVDLYYSLVKLFSVKDNAPRWLFGSGKARAGVFTVEDFHKIAVETDDVREMHAIALFLWLNGFEMQDFLIRVLHVLEGRFDTIFEGYVLHCPRLNADNKKLFRDMLVSGQPNSVLDVCIALFALDGEIESVTYQRMLSMAVYLIRDRKPDVVADVGLYYALTTFSEKAEGSVPNLIKALCKLATNTIVKRNSYFANECAYYGLVYRDVLMLTFLFHEKFSDYYFYGEKGNLLKSELFMELGLMTSEWSESVKSVIPRIVKQLNPACVVNAGNVKWCVDNGLLDKITTHINYPGVPEALINAQAESAFNVITGGLDLDSPLEIVRVATQNPVIVDLLFRNFYREFTELYSILFEDGTLQLEKYRLYYADYLSDFKDMRSIDLLKEVNSDRDSFEYQLLMQKCLTSSASLGKRANALLLKETKNYVYLYAPEKYTAMFGGDSNEKN